MRAGLLLASLALLLATPAQARTVGIQLHDNPLHIAPEAILAEPGETLDLLVINQGSTQHNLIVCDIEDRGGCNAPLAFTPLLASRQNATLNITFPTPGTYAYHCDIPGHTEGGMKGEFKVQATTNSSPGAPLALLLVALAGLTLLGRRT